MSNPLDRLLNKIHALQTISEEERNALLKDFKEVKKEQERIDFKIKRILKDKTIVVNILEATIMDLEKNQLKIRNANELLNKQKEELQKQKKIIETHSQELSRNLSKLELSYKELEQFSYVASHDLKSPLRTISSFAQLLHRRYTHKINEEANEFLDFIITGVAHMNEVINGLLLYSKIGNNNDSFVEVNINEVLDLVRFNLKAEIRDTGTCIKQNEMPIILGNKIGIIQLFQNLVHNAIKFKSEKTPEIFISCNRIPQSILWEFKVADNGIGMSNEYQKKVFMPFQRLRNDDNLGTGIGLAICQKVVHLHQGTIRYDSSPGKGTTFIFTLASA